MIKEGFNYKDSTIKEMTYFFETRVEIVEPKEDKKNLNQLQNILRIKSLPKEENRKTPTQRVQ